MPTTPLKVDLHMHSRGDPYDDIGHSPEELINKAAGLGFDAIAITNHDCQLSSQRLDEYAAERGVLLIRGMELTYEGRHIVLVNFDDTADVFGPEEILKARRPDNLVIAAHPYFPFAQSSGDLLDAMPELFDAVEYAHLYINAVNCNLRAMRRAGELGLPLVGTSDAHSLSAVGYTYTLVRSEKTPAAIVSAIKKGNGELVTRPLPFGKFCSLIASAAWGSLRRYVLKLAGFGLPGY